MNNIFVTMFTTWTKRIGITNPKINYYDTGYYQKSTLFTSNCKLQTLELAVGKSCSRGIKRRTKL